MRPSGSEQELTPRWGLVANVVDTRLASAGGAPESGASQFAGGAKVFYHSAFWGMGAERVTVVGHQRASKRSITISLDFRFLHRWRSEVIYRPAVLRLLVDGEIRSETDAVRLQNAFAEAAPASHRRVVERSVSEASAILAEWREQRRSVVQECGLEGAALAAFVRYEQTTPIGVIFISSAEGPADIYAIDEAHDETFITLRNTVNHRGTDLSN